MRTLGGMQRFAEAHGGWIFHLYDYRMIQTRFATVLNAFAPIAHGVYATEMEPEHAALLAQSGLPTVGHVDILEESSPFPYAHADSHAIGRLAAAHLADLGHTRFAFVDGHRLRHGYARNRLEGFRDGLAARGLTTDVHTYAKAVTAPDVREDHLQGLADWVAAHAKPLAVFASGDAIGHDVLNACLLAGVPVPGEVAVLGADNDELYARACRPPLSSVDTRAEAVGYATGRMLHALMRGKQLPDTVHTLPPGDVIARGSTDALAFADPALTRAVSFLRECATQPGLSVRDVVVHAGVSRRKVENLFRHRLHCTVQAEIHRVRIQRACALLRETDRTIADISTACGFSDAPRLFPVFKRLMGTTPRAYRLSRSDMPRRAAT